MRVSHACVTVSTQAYKADATGIDPEVVDAIASQERSGSASGGATPSRPSRNAATVGSLSPAR